MIRSLLSFLLVGALALPAYAGGIHAAGRSVALLGKELSRQSVQRGAAGLVLSACLSIAGCLPFTGGVVVYAPEGHGDLSNTSDHRDAHTVNRDSLWGINSVRSARSVRELARAEMITNRSGSSTTYVSNHGHSKFGGDIEWHGHKYSSKWLFREGEDSIYGLRYWNRAAYYDNRDNLTGDALISVLFTYIAEDAKTGDDVFRVGIGYGTPIFGDHNYTDLKQVGATPRPPVFNLRGMDWTDTIPVRDISGVLFTHHPYYEQPSKVSFVEQSMQPLVQDWLALQEAATRQAFQQSEGRITFEGERLGIFTDGEMLIEVTTMKFANGDSHLLQGFPVLVYEDDLLTN